MGKCPDCGARTYADDGDSCDCTKCSECFTVGNEEFTSEVDGNQYCEECLAEKTGEHTGVLADGSDVFEMGVMRYGEYGKMSFEEVESETLAVPEGATAYNEQLGWVLPLPKV